ncbi:MAG: glycerol-3-phosphate 1-O-acyltransferase PlsY [Bacteroidales bacterium]|nr:glycerol-3-phosphate 1-O-acyltransferase PlsY [Bacteroidales bacterium]HPS95298.1 glycerol-3-phosphate 1-O-acyltransferase PlsY [Bacteroidales bacterium]
MHLWYLLLLPLSYIIGSFSPAIRFGKFFYGIDVRDYGSKNPGANNVQRVLGWKPALFVFLFDTFKGVAGASLAHFTSFETGTNMFVGAQIVLGLTAVLGHIFPVFHQYKGGKGVATITGVLWAIHPYAVLICFGIFLIMFLITRYVSLSAIISITLFPFFVNSLFALWLDPKVTLTLKIFSIIIAIVIWLTHISNIKRIIKGKEEKFRLNKGITEVPEEVRTIYRNPR